MKYKTSGLTRKEYEKMLNESLSGVIVNIEGMFERFSYLNIQSRYLIDAFNKKKIATLIRKFDNIVFEDGFEIWKKSFKTKINDKNNNN